MSVEKVLELARQIRIHEAEAEQLREQIGKLVGAKSGPRAAPSNGAKDHRAAVGAVVDLLNSVGPVSAKPKKSKKRKKSSPRDPVADGRLREDILKAIETKPRTAAKLAEGVGVSNSHRFRRLMMQLEKSGYIEVRRTKMQISNGQFRTFDVWHRTSRAPSHTP